MESQMAVASPAEQDDDALARRTDKEHELTESSPVWLRALSSRRVSSNREMQGAIDEAAAVSGCPTELGVLRLTLKRLVEEMSETEDPIRLAETITRVANASIRAVQAHQALLGDGLQNALTEVLIQLEAEQET